MSRYVWASCGCGAGIAGAVLLPYPLHYWALGAVWVAYLATVVLGVTFIRMRFFLDSTCRGPADTKRVALTFDDGPDPESTSAVLDALDEAGVQAVFFCVGARVEAQPDIVRRIVSEGHLVANHSQHHAWTLNFRMRAGLTREIGAAQEAITDVTGTPPRWYRPPVGLTNPHLAGALRKLGLACVGWDVRGFDCHAQAAAPIVQRVLSKARNGSIIALHDSGVDPAVQAEAVTRIVKGLQDKGYEIVRLDELLGGEVGAEQT